MKIFEALDVDELAWYDVISLKPFVSGVKLIINLKIIA